MTETLARPPTRSRTDGCAARRVRLPIIGPVAMPPPSKLAYYAGVGVLAVLEVIEWPLALVITAGHILADQHMSRLANGFGEALEQA